MFFARFRVFFATDFDVQYIKLTGIIPEMSWGTLFCEKNIRKGPKTTKNGPTWLSTFH